MTDRREHHDIGELLVPYALGQLAGAELERVQAALEGDASLRRELLEIEEAGAMLLAGSLPTVTAPPELRTRVMGAIGAAEQRSDANAAGATAAPVADLGAARTRRSLRWGGFAMPALAGGLAVACVALATVAIGLNDDLDSAEQRIDRIERDGAGRSTDGDDGSTTLPTATMHDVETSAQMAKSSGKLMRVADDRWVLLVDDVPDPGQGNSWQVWTADSKGAIRNVGQWLDGASSHVIVLDSDDVVEVMVSFEETTAPVPTPGSAPVVDVKV